ncbi:MAG: putative ABC transporter permease [Lachnospiraceae bacterium]|nr:putative ABC transporter permease [Lachnospiraceae bacterium]
MFLGKYFVMFTIYSVIGWVYETTYCMIKSKKWENRGFLYGPVCPIYGVGATSITLLTDFLGSAVIVSGLKWWHVFLIGMLGSAVLEYFTSWILEVRFHAYWWDYKDVPLNINGRICLPASVGFGVAGLFVVYILSPYTRGILTYIPSVLMELLSMVFLAVMVSDLTLTVSALTHFEQMVISFEDSVNRYMDQFVENVNEKKLSGVIEDAAKDKMEYIMSTMEESTRMAVRRVRGFRNTKLSIGVRKRPDFVTMERFKEEIKKYHVKIEKVTDETKKKIVGN